MTVLTSSNIAGPYTGDASNTTFDFSFKVFSSADLQVVLTDADDTETTLVLNTDYSVTIAADYLSGTVTYPLSGDPLPSTSTLSIIRVVDYTQGAAFQNQGGFYPKTHENAYDKATMQIQQIKEMVDRAPLFTRSSGKVNQELVPTPGYYVAYDADGNITSAAGTGADAGLRTDLAAATGADLVGYSPDGAGAVATTVGAIIDRFVSRIDYSSDAYFTAAGNDPTQKLSQLDIYATSTNWVQIVLGDRGTVLRPAVSNSRTTFNVTPNGTPSGTNTSYGTIRVWGQDVEADPNGSRTSINMEMHYDGDLALRSRLATRSEGTPSLPHPDFYWQINGCNFLYAAKKRDGTTGLASMGVFNQGMHFKGVADSWEASTVYAPSDEVKLAKSDHLYLVCTVGGTSGGTEPTPAQSGTTVADGSVTWLTKSRLQDLSDTDDAVPGIWFDQNGNVGFGTQAPGASYDYVSAARFQAGLYFKNGGVTGVTINNVLTGSLNSAFGGSISAGGSATASVTVTGAAVGDIVSMGLPNANMIAGLVYNAWVDATNSVRVRVTNITGSPIATTTQTYKVMVTKTS